MKKYGNKKMVNWKKRVRKLKEYYPDVSYSKLRYYRFSTMVKEKWRKWPKNPTVEDIRSWYKETKLRYLGVLLEDKDLSKFEFWHNSLKTAKFVMTINFSRIVLDMYACDLLLDYVRDSYGLVRMEKKAETFFYDDLDDYHSEVDIIIKILKDQYELCKSYGNQQRVDRYLVFLPQDVCNNIKFFL